MGQEYIKKSFEITVYSSFQRTGARRFEKVLSHPNKKKWV